MRSLVLILALTVPLAAQPDADQPNPGAFKEAVGPGLATCAACHNEIQATGGLKVGGLDVIASVGSQRGQWERIVQKVSSGEMPPRGFPPLDRTVKTKLLNAARDELDRLDRLGPPDPGRVTAQRLNRTEYANTIRDLLGIRFRAQDEFPSDDSGYGFDNIGDVLTVSPILMEDYLAAAEMISRQAIGADPLPERPVEAGYDYRGASNMGPFEQLGPTLVQMRHRLEWDGEYTIRIGLQGERPKGSSPVRLAIWRDGEKLHELMAPTEPSGLVYFEPFSMETMRLHLAAGDSTFRVGFIDDHFTDRLCKEDIYNRNRNKFVGEVTFVGPFRSDVEPPSRRKILICDPGSGRECVERIISALARRAYRRPILQQDVDDLLSLVDLAETEGLSIEQGIQLALQGMLVSPHFLFRIERDPNPIDSEAKHRISDIELASRLSYFLWSSMPDEELVGLAEQRKLSDPAVLGAQVSRMLKDERSQELAANFAGQWLETRNLDSVNPDPELFPEWGPEIREAMKTETTLFFDAILDENLPLTMLLDADFSYLNDRLATHYGIEGVKGPEFRRVRLATPQRGGVLSHASVLTVTSYPTRTSPVIRGKFVLGSILGSPPPDPPPDVPALEESGASEGMTVRKQLEAHRSHPACASCHERMDTLGFGLENYDAIGRWRAAENDVPVDASGTLPSGESFDSPAELRRILMGDKKAFTRTVTEKMLIYALGRGLKPYDRRTVTDAVNEVAADDYRFQTLIHAIVKSMPFQMRRGEAEVVAAAR